ncbi:MAG: hypothetical protein DPW09_17515 [Anaerolineae bacterium]|nr:hypothetical protein [Anaerolineae bacterium]
MLKEIGIVKTPNLYEISAGLSKAGIDINFGPDVSRLVIQIWRLLAEGRPITLEQVEQIAAHLQIPHNTLTAFQSKYKAGFEFNAEGNIVGWIGLSLNPHHSYRFQVNDHLLFAWCGWDTLFLPPILKQTAVVESSCPATAKKIRLTITPEGVELYEPTSAVISIIIPKTNILESGSAEGVWLAFCNHVHIFSSPEAASEWFLGKDEEPIILSIEEGYQLGRIRFEENLKYA